MMPSKYSTFICILEGQRGRGEGGSNNGVHFWNHGYANGIVFRNVVMGERDPNSWSVDTAAFLVIVNSIAD